MILSALLREGRLEPFLEQEQDQVNRPLSRHNLSIDRKSVKQLDEDESRRVNSEVEMGRLERVGERVEMYSIDELANRFTVISDER